MKFSVITIFPEIIENTLQYGVVGKAIKSGLVKLQCINPRIFAKDNHKSVDDRPFGGGDGMVMLCDPVSQAIDIALKDEQEARVIYLTPQGATLTHNKVLELKKYKSLILLCGRYGGIDQRVIAEKVDEEISIGDYVLSGGEIAANVLIDALARQVDGVLGHNESSINDSFSDGLLEAPVFTRPSVWNNRKVPAEFLSGHHENIKKFQKSLSLIITFKKRPDLFMKAVADKKISDLEMKFAVKNLEGLTVEVLQSLGLDNRDCEFFIKWVKDAQFENN